MSKHKSTLNALQDPRQSAEQSNDVRHQLWMIYSQLRDAENDQLQRLELLERSREELGKVLNEMNRQSSIFLAQAARERKSPIGKFKLSRGK